ncbi:MAG TPA: Fic family protein, partial [Ramlibacter sp.]
MNFDYPQGATPLDPDEAAELIPSHINTHKQLNEWELVNIVEGERWAFGRKHRDLLDGAFESIHPFANGNGRLSRTMADLLLVHHGASRFSWGSGANLVEEGAVR